MPIISFEVHVKNLTRDGIDSWICDLEVCGQQIREVYLRGATEAEALEDLKRSVRFIPATGGDTPIPSIEWKKR